MQPPLRAYALELWDGQEHALDFRLLSPDTGALLGLLPTRALGRVVAQRRGLDRAAVAAPRRRGDGARTVRAYGRNQGRPLVAALGDAFRPLCIGGGEELHTLRFRLDRPARMLHIMGIDPRPLAGAAEERSIGFGITSLRLLPAADATVPASDQARIACRIPGRRVAAGFLGPRAVGYLVGIGSALADAAPARCRARILRVELVGYAQNAQRRSRSTSAAQTCTVVPRAKARC